MRVLTDEQESKIRKEYESGDSTVVLSRRYSRTHRRICVAIRRAGGKLRTRKETSEAELFSKDQSIELRGLYESGDSLGALSKRFGGTASTIMKYVIKSGGKMRPQAESCRIHPVNHGFFDEIDTEEKAYWLGFISADGNVTRDVVRIALKSSDDSHLRKFSEDIGSDCVPKIYAVMTKNLNVFTYSGISVCSRQVVDSLNKLGVVSNKSLVLRPASVDPILERHYWRGVIDGDGTVGMFGGNSQPRVSLIGSLWVVRGFCDYVQRISGEIKEPKSHVSVWNVCFAKRRVAEVVARELYENCSVSLDRKQIAAESIWLCRKPRRQFRRKLFKPEPLLASTSAIP